MHYMETGVSFIYTWGNHGRIQNNNGSFQSAHNRERLLLSSCADDGSSMDFLCVVLRGL